MNAPLSAAPTYEMELAFSLSLDGTNFGPWGGCGTTVANAGAVGETDFEKFEDTGTMPFAGCQTFTVTTRGRLYQDGINDPAGAYSQATPLLLTLYDADPAIP